MEQNKPNIKESEFCKLVCKFGNWEKEYQPQAFLKRGWRFIYRDNKDGRWVDPATGAILNADKAIEVIEEREVKKRGS